MTAPQAGNAACIMPGTVLSINLAALNRGLQHNRTNRCCHAPCAYSTTRLPARAGLVRAGNAAWPGQNMMWALFSTRDFPADGGTRPIGDATHAQADVVRMHALSCLPLEPGVSDLQCECSGSLCKTAAGHTAMFWGPLSSAGAESATLMTRYSLHTE